MNRAWPGNRLSFRMGVTLLSAVFLAGSEPGVPSTGSELGGTSWRLVKFQGSDETTLRRAVFEATLENVSKGDAPAEVIGKTRVEKPGHPPIPFEIPYDAARIDPSHRYVVRARILVAEKPVFATDTQYPVLGGHSDENVTLMLRRASAPAASLGGGASLEGSSWKLTRLGDAAVTASSPARQPHLTFDKTTGRVTGLGGCNRLTGSYEVRGDQVTFRGMAGTMMACIDGMDTEKALLDTLAKTDGWKITGSQLELLDAAGNVLARFEAMP